ncbi:bifunctional diguanylate cyclase/phosphodiesterase [Oceanobacillus manasiensis]|uniref:bifunctional diguanylate cyclase/phosphodiesterase n=1 Tax=Oceanobacillus manasiensis TaxID=586413 RepID=UPI0005A9BED3|nr:bifunctional diguanylate cyclase/phosphodiesterase [Oceanobacillus manasiensis]
MITAEYNVPLVILSIAIAIFSSYTALSLVNRLKLAKGNLRRVWLSAGAFSFGFGIWSMHFIAMLAFHLSIEVSYNVVLVVLSILLAVLASGIAFFIVSKELTKRRFMLIGAFFIGTGIVSMHYIGMDAMQMEATIVYNHFLLILSFIIAYLTSWAALYLLFYFQKDSSRFSLRVRKVISSVVMGMAISGMHYTGMAAADFTTMHEHHAMHNMGGTINSTIMAYTVGVGMAVILGIVLVSIYFDRRLQLKTSELEFIDNIYQSFVMNASDAVILSNGNNKIISWNKAAEEIFGYKAVEALGQDVEIMIPERFRQAHREKVKPYLNSNQTSNTGKPVEVLGLKKDGTELPIELSFSTLKREEETYFSRIIRDISERKKAEEQINELVYRDPLTDLPNRRLFNNYLSKCIEQASFDGQILAVLFIDLDRFKNINDSLGHATGDSLLKEMARRMEACIGKKDMLARQGGDEYILIFPHTSHKEIANTAQAILESINQPFFHEQNELIISGSIGISIYPEDGMDAETLVKHADISMYRAKELGKNNYQFFTSDMNDIIANKMNLELGLRKALVNDEFVLHYQPQVDVKTGNIKGMEALIRWQHPDLGLVPPNKFIPLAEETGLIIPIGKWVMQTACEQAKKWEALIDRPLRVSVNISALQFQQSDFTSVVKEVLQTTNFPASSLELELTESIVQDPEHALPVMMELKEMGVLLSLDDFGTGYSSLSYLRSFPLDTLKIDKLFIDNMHHVKDEAIVSTIISMANSLELNVIAEGVETNDQLHSLTGKACDEYQGYLFSKPIPQIELEKILQDNRFTIPEL